MVSISQLRNLLHRCGESFLLKRIILRLISFPSDIICLMDVAINFRSSYQDHQSEIIVLEVRKIVMHYMRYYFWVDLLSSFPDRIIQTWVRKLFDIFVFDGTCHEHSSLCRFVSHLSICSAHRQLCGDQKDVITYFHSKWDVFAAASLLKILQLPLFFKYLTNYLQRRNRSKYFIKIVRVRLEHSD